MLKEVVGNVIFLGLSDKNIEQLQKEEPIIFDGSQIDLNGLKIVIFHGKNEEVMLQKLIDTGYNYL